MITTLLKNIRIRGLASAVSDNWDDLDKYKELMGEANVDKFKRSTGVKGRYISPEKQTTADLAFAAAQKLIEKYNISPENDIDAIVFVSQTADYTKPATACVLHKRLGLKKDCIAYDISLGCSGFVYGIYSLGSIMSTSNIRRALLMVGDTSGRIQMKSDFYSSTDVGKLLFGDAAAAAILESDTTAKDIRGAFRTDGNGYKAIISPYRHYRHPEGKFGTLMDGVEVFNFTINEVPALIKEFMASTNTTTDDYDCLVLHQANLYIMKQVAKRTGFPLDKMLVSIDEYANTSSASIPTALTKYYGKETTGKKLKALMCGFGVGLSWGIISAEIDTNDILPLTQTNDYFDDGM